MSANQAVFPIATMARVLGVSEAGYHAWRHRPPSAHAVADATLLKRVRTIHATSRATYGAPRVHAQLRADGEKHGRKRIARLMRMAGLVGASRRRAGVTTTRRDKEARPAPDLVDRNFVAVRPNQLWVADITFVPTASGFLYLAVVLDAWSRKIVGWSMANHLRAELVVDALEMAIGQRRPGDVIHHSDQGNILRWRSVNAARRPVYGLPWVLLATPTTTPCARASLPPWNASCWIAAGSCRRPKPGWLASASLRAGTTPFGCIPHWATSRRSPMNSPWRQSPRNRNYPSPRTLHENGAASDDLLADIEELARGQLARIDIALDDDQAEAEDSGIAEVQRRSSYPLYRTA